MAQAPTDWLPTFRRLLYKELSHLLVYCAPEEAGGDYARNSTGATGATPAAANHVAPGWEATRVTLASPCSIFHRLALRSSLPLTIHASVTAEKCVLRAIRK